MANNSRTFIAGRMNKVVDERLVPNGEYIDALNIRMGSTENAEIGVIENSKGNEPLTALAYIDGTPLSSRALCIGAIDDTANDTIYWFVHDSNFTVGATGKLDLIVSYNTNSQILKYHLISINDGGGVDTTLNFNPKYTITGVNIVDDLLFFTDDYNQPRFINIKRNYPNPILDIDQFTDESILVIKKPPTSAPSIQPYESVGQENFMDTRFISFAYRYKYIDGEYSATSQWSPVSFLPGQFFFNINSWLNEGMVNNTNSCAITYYSGGPLVVGIDLLFKQGDSNIIKVIEKLDKGNLGLSDNTYYTYNFDNSKIFTVLPESELLRLYDNVPRLAKAQTLMGNRIMYGNYVEGYDMIDQNGYPTNLDYEASLVSNSINQQDLPDSTTSGNYSVDVPITIPNSVVGIDLTGAPLTQGSIINLEIRFKHYGWGGATPFPSVTTQDTDVDFSFLLPISYASVYDMATSPQFQAAVGTSIAANFLPVYAPTGPTSCDGTTLTDQINCLIPNNLGPLTKYNSGITALSQGCNVIAVPGFDFIAIQIPAMQFVDNVSTPTQYVVEYYEITIANASYQEVGTPRSLHSNRGYEVGIVYMDEFNRSTTTLVSKNNTIHVPCSNSALQNNLHVEIPVSQRAPYWAKKYKFVCKADVDNYETIYTNLWFIDSANPSYAWFLLDGENARKAEKGDRLIVKSDTSGPTTNCTYTTVLDKESKSSGAFTTSSPAGVYVKLSINDFNAVIVPDAVISRSGSGTFSSAATPIIRIYMNTGTQTTPNNLTVDIPAGSKIVINAKWERVGTGNLCEKREYTYNKTFVSTTSYDNLKDWFELDGIAATINDGVAVVSPSSGNCPIQNTYNSTLLPTGSFTSTSLCTNYWQFENGGIDANSEQKVILQLSGTYGCASFGNFGSSKRDSKINATITVYRAINMIVFETIPQDTLPDVFYENHLSFDIGPNGEHLGNIQNQNFGTNTSAIIDTEFFNCFTFGNGVESYKIRDSIVGNYFNLGNRVTSVSAQDYKEARRYADITYSGIYNNESNVNKLNEFNLGLLNYKPLEDSFGRIFKLDGRETDVLVLQEDKVSYVLAGKNLLSDSAAGGAITSVPEVLGTQIARVEKYGISFNPESYVHWGYDRYFTDAKRGAVLQLKGNSYNSDQLRVVSEQGMRTWFRDVFNDSFLTQKLGGFDPYMNEYVLCSNERPIPENPACIDCGFSATFALSSADIKDPSRIYCVNLGNGIGASTVSYVVTSITNPTSYQICAKYDGLDTCGSVEFNTTSGSFSFNKTQSNIDTAEIYIYLQGEMTITITVDCPLVQTVNIVELVLTSDYESGQTIHTEYRYVNGVYFSPIQQSLVTFGSSPSAPVVSRYNISTGAAGSPGFPTDTSTMFIQTNKIVPDSFNFDLSNDKLRWHRDTTLYGTTVPEINSLLSLSTTLPVSNTGNVFYGSFTVPAGMPNDYIYLIWDFRDSVGQSLCYSNNIDTVCCECTSCDFDNECVRIEVSNPDRANPAAINLPNGLCGGSLPVSIEIAPEDTIYLCVNYPVEIVLGDPFITILECGCGDCEEGCSMWRVENITENTTISWENCDGNPTNVFLPFGTDVYILCGQTNQIPEITEGSADVIYHRCGCCYAQCWSTSYISLDFDYQSLQIAAIIIDAVTYSPTSALYFTDTVGVTNFVNSLDLACGPIGNYSYEYNPSNPSEVKFRFDYTCCDMTAITLYFPIGGASFSFDTVTCNPPYEGF